MKRKEGFIDVLGGKVWYEIVGEKKGIPLLVLHGGPGYPHDYLQPLEDISNKREVIFYDQLGCGNSGKSTDKSLWTVTQFVTELQKIVRALDLKRYHILGHSWGAGLAVSFALEKPKGLTSLILSDPYISTPQWEKGVKKLLKQLPREMQRALEGTINKSKAYKKASSEFYYRFVFRLKQLPTALVKSQNKMNSDIYNYMWGPEEFRTTGTLKDFDLTGRLSEIKVPVLLLCGKYDEATPESLEYFYGLFPNSQFKVFGNSAHVPHWTDRKIYIKTVQDFLRNIEK